MTFGQNGPKLNSRPVYCSRLYVYVTGGNKSILLITHRIFENFMKVVRRKIIKDPIVVCHLFSRIPTKFSSILRYLKSVPTNFVVNIFCHCDSIIDFLANSYLILQIHHAKSFKMRHITYL